jgi:hypothetical protein
MDKGWPFYMSKHDHEVSSSRSRKKKERQRHHVSVDAAWKLLEENRTAPWRDVSLPSGCLLNSRRVLVPRVPHEGSERGDEVRCRPFILPDLRDDPSFALYSGNWMW